VQTPEKTLTPLLVPVATPMIPKVRKPKWEKALPEKYTISATGESNSLKLKVELETTDTSERKSVNSLVDSGANGEFIDRDYAKSCRFNLIKLTSPIPVYNIDGSPNEAGSITEAVSLILRYKNHSERTTFCVTSLGKQKLILGHSWLRKHNPEIDWTKGEVKMSRCPPRCCSGCRDELRQERITRKAEARRIDICSVGPIPEVNHDSENDSGLDATDSENEPISVEEGDRILATGLLPPPSMNICASSTISQRLAEAFQTNAEAVTPVPGYLKEFTSVFSKQTFDVLPEPKEWDHAVELIPGSKPSGCKIYPLSPAEQKELDAFLKENLETGRIRPSKSPMSSPVFFIKKKDGSLRLVQDYRALNAVTIKNKYPLPLISELINKLQGARYFTKLDVRWGFNNVRMKDGDEWKAAFRTNRGLYEPLVMFFGLTNSPATFQTMMDGIFEDLISEGVVVVYLDDILIFTKTLEEHRKVVRRVMEILQKYSLSLKPEKCEFEKTSVEYLGVVVSHDSVKMDPAKVAGVSEWPTPSNKKEVQSFLGFINFYRRFIEGFSHIARPLFDLTKADSVFKWSSEEKSAFDTLRDRITSAPILTLPDNSRPYRVEADSSDFATGAVLSQENPEDGKWHPVAFLSKSLSPVERNYEIHDKEMLAIVRALEEWRHFLEGTEHQFEIWTDHKNLEYFMTAKKLNRRQARWSLLLARFDFLLHHRPGKTMGKPDALSRRSDHGSGTEDNQNLTLLTPNLFAIRALEGLQAVGEERDILKEIRRGMEAEDQEEVVITAVKELKKSPAKSVRSSEWSLENGLLYYRGKVYVPGTELRRRILTLCHDSKLAGHPGRWKTLELVSRNYWWPQMSRYIGKYVSTCDMCLRTKSIRQPPSGELHPLPIPDAPWDTASVDFITELPESNGKDAIMVVVDSVTKRSHFVSTVTTLSAAGTAQLYLRHIWKHHGLPRRVVSDRGPQFVAEFTRELYRLLGVKLAATTAYHPQGDGQTERINQELEQFLRLFINQRQDNWDDLLPFAEFQYNNHIHSATQNVPFFLDTGRIPRMGFEPDQRRSHIESVNEFKERMEDALNEAKAALVKSKDDMVKYYDRRRTPAPEYQPGDRVYLDASDIHTTRPSRKLSHRRLGPFSVIRKVGNGAYRLRLPPSMSRLHPVFNVVKLTLAPEDPVPGRRLRPPPLPEIVNGEEEFIVEEILDSRVINRKLRYLVKWEGYGIEHNSWEPADDVHAPERVADFHRKHPGAPRHIRFADFDTIPFRTISTAAPGRHSLEGGVDVRGHSYRPTFQTEYLRPTIPDTFRACNALYVPPHRR
jgi:RNase H-like domain found in reverse transcriptase/Reverse transcriptase (RNA-dependent DNA polymerase)/Integrase zinc binding domain/Chromo (CHRromatin Organisation MOdifier) domain